MIVSAYTQCDICGRTIVEKVTGEETETTGRLTVFIKSLDGIKEYDVCQSCLNDIEFANDGRPVILTVHEIVQ